MGRHGGGYLGRSNSGGRESPGIGLCLIGLQPWASPVLNVHSCCFPFLCGLVFCLSWSHSFQLFVSRNCRHPEAITDTPWQQNQGPRTSRKVLHLSISTPGLSLFLSKHLGWSSPKSFGNNILRGKKIIQRAYPFFYYKTWPKLEGCWKQTHFSIRWVIGTLILCPLFQLRMWNHPAIVFYPEFIINSTSCYCFSNIGEKHLLSRSFHLTLMKTKPT